MASKTNRFPTGHVLGFISSIVLTFIATGVALKTNLSFNVIMWIIGSLAVIQAGLQLFMFMHMTEGEDGKANIINIGYGVFIAVVIVVGSIWVLTAGHAAH
ncbi:MULTISPECIES: cytochrome aa3 quinol oxidase subunit IV [Bacillaceae]|uniref:cytochrome aa3 quinol oxidase subunit IV n=1 Tax=Bacillaceae TaxID=186817 RepID=UPI001BDF2F0A|nr:MULTISPECIES: cytochrome aa3 quinol oxidase subunit IV [Bacillaceae]MDX8362005.1 cytochrome aa3 quinol oxidase subunit IV [Cytobacillus sp. IB215316]MDX8364725.1 cytochrome aa3 quinol oxidase subunit IV [Cytobacillus sp. IB215665]